MEKAKRKHTLPNRLIAFMLTFAMIVSVLSGVLPGSEMTAEAATGSETFTLTRNASDSGQGHEFTGTHFKIENNSNMRVTED